VRGQVVDRCLDLSGEPLAEVGVPGGVDAEGIGSRHHAHPLGQALEPAERGRDGGDLRGDAVIGVARDDDAGAARSLLGDAQREVARLRPGARVHHVRHGVGHRGEELLGVAHDPLVQVARVGRELRGLLGDRRHHARVGVPDRGDVVVRARYWCRRVGTWCQAACATGIVEPIRDRDGNATTRSAITLKFLDPRGSVRCWDRRRPLHPLNGARRRAGSACAVTGCAECAFAVDASQGSGGAVRAAWQQAARRALQRSHTQ
jgi:hypothetical protein